jgi:hypothetical protein
MAKRKRKSPSRLRCEKAHPVVTLRLTIALRDRLKAVMADAGLSAADWVRSHLDRDEAQVSVMVRELALERDGLGEQMRAKRRELDEVEHLLGERRQKLDASLDEEMKAERQRRLAKLEYDVRVEAASKGQALARVEQQIAAKNKEIAALDDEIKEKRGQRFTLDLELGNRERLKRELAEQALAELRRQGVPFMACLNCSAYVAFKALAQMTKSVVEAMPPVGGAVKPTTPSSQQ